MYRRYDFDHQETFKNIWMSILLVEAKLLSQMGKYCVLEVGTQSTSLSLC